MVELPFAQILSYKVMLSVSFIFSCVFLSKVYYSLNIYTIIRLYLEAFGFDSAKNTRCRLGGTYVKILKL